MSDAEEASRTARSGRMASMTPRESAAKLVEEIESRARVFPDSEVGRLIAALRASLSRESAAEERAEKAEESIRGAREETALAWQQCNNARADRNALRSCGDVLNGCDRECLACAVGDADGWQRRALKAEADNRKTLCSYCGEVFERETIEDARAAVIEHVLVCEKNAFRVWLDQAIAERDTAREEIARLKTKAAWKDAFDEGEARGMRSNTTDAENPHPEGSTPYCGWSFGFWQARLRSERDAALRLVSERGEALKPFAEALTTEGWHSDIELSDAEYAIFRWGKGVATAGDVRRARRALEAK